MIEVIKPGLLDLVMDLGRPGFRSQGVPEGGAADALSLILANRLVGNPDAAAGFEFLLRGPCLRFPLGARVALTGARMEMRLNGKSVSWGRTLDIPVGAELESGPASDGVRSYLAVAGGLDVPLVLGSRSVFLPSGFGGFQGRALAEGDILTTFGQAVQRTGKLKKTGVQTCLRILPGPQLAGFSDDAIQSLTGAGFKVGAEASRLGLRLVGPALYYAQGDSASQAVLPGAIQVTPDGQPIVLGWDGPVTGGYPVIAGIIAADLPLLAQCKPGDPLKFCFVTFEQAQEAWRQQQKYLDGAITWED